MTKRLLFFGSVLGGLSVAMGAFGAHVMRGRYTPYAMEIFEKGVRYEMYHALAMLVTALFLTRFPTNRWFNLAGILFLTGILFFSGSLYLLAFTGMKWLGAVTPIGGVAFLAGWIFLAIGASRVV